MSLGRRLRQARIDAGYADIEAFAGAVGAPVASLMAWEADLQSPASQELDRIAAVVAIEPGALISSEGAQGICQAVDLVPDAGQAEALEQAGIPSALWRDSATWLAFLRLADAASHLSPTELSDLAHNTARCVGGDPEKS